VSMINHTPGPWSAHEKGAHPNPYVCGAEREYEHGPDKPVVAYIVGTDTQANARLIAAAPDLLAVVREACAIFDANHEGGEMDEYNGDLANDLWKDEIHRKLTDAIAKAEGLALPLHEGSGE